MLEIEKVSENFDLYMDLCGKLGKRKEIALEFVNHFGERIAACPASTKTSFPGSYPGGLVEQNLAILQNALRVNTTFELGVKKSSILLCCLFRNIGLLGTKDDELLIAPEIKYSFGFSDVNEPSGTPYDNAISSLRRNTLKISMLIYF